ncbi:MAG: DUF3309 family protein [Calditrichia bacterium]
MLSIILLFIILALLLILTLPKWPYSRSWGYTPSGGILILMLLIIVALISIGKI